MLTSLIFKNAYQTVLRSVQDYRWLEDRDELSRKRVDFEWSSPDVTHDEVKKCLFDAPLNRIEGNGGDWWSSEDEKYSKELWEHAVDFSDADKKKIIDHVIKKMQEKAVEEKRKAAAEEKRKAVVEKKRKAAAEKKKANDAEKKRKAAAGDEQPCAKNAASQGSPETDGYDSDELEPLPDWRASRSRTVL